MSNLPTQGRKDLPVATGVLEFFPRALAEVAKVSVAGAKQRNSKSLVPPSGEVTTGEHADCLVRHLLDRGTLDNDGVRHSAKVAWRALSLLEQEVNDERRTRGSDITV